MQRDEECVQRQAKGVSEGVEWGLQRKRKVCAAGTKGFARGTNGVCAGDDSGIKGGRTEGMHGVD
eukprot:4320782-Prorocentrum_lima.AAC.1